MVVYFGSEKTGGRVIGRGGRGKGRLYGAKGRGVLIGLMEDGMVMGLRGGGVVGWYEGEEGWYAERVKDYGWSLGKYTIIDT